MKKAGNPGTPCVRFRASRPFSGTPVDGPLKGARRRRGKAHSRGAERWRTRHRRRGSGFLYGRSFAAEAAAIVRFSHRPVNNSTTRGMCAVGFSPGTPVANALGHGVLGTPCPRKWLRGVKSASNPLEPNPNHGRTPSPWGKKYLDYRPPSSISKTYEQRPGLDTIPHRTPGRRRPRLKLPRTCSRRPAHRLDSAAWRRPWRAGPGNGERINERRQGRSGRRPAAGYRRRHWAPPARTTRQENA